PTTHSVDTAVRSAVRPSRDRCGTRRDRPGSSRRSASLAHPNRDEPREGDVPGNQGRRRAGLWPFDGPAINLKRVVGSLRAFPGRCWRASPMVLRFLTATLCAGLFAGTATAQTWD